jgi:hypothetical protein
MSRMLTMQGWARALRILISRRAVTGMPSFSLCISMRLSATTAPVRFSMALWTSLAEDERGEGRERKNGPKGALAELGGEVIIGLASAASEIATVGLFLVSEGAAELALLWRRGGEFLGGALAVWGPLGVSFGGGSDHGGGGGGEFQAK